MSPSEQSVALPTIRFVTVDQDPLDPLSVFTSDEPRLDHTHDALPEPFRAALLTVINAGEGRAICWRCGERVGFVLHEDDDEPWRSGLYWHHLTLAQEGARPVAWLCEDCAPDVPRTSGGAR